MRVGTETIQLAQRGHSFVAELDAAAHGLELPMHYISRTTMSQNFDGSSRYDILGLEAHDEDHPSRLHLVDPLFIAPELSDQETSLPIVAGNPLVNARDCSPDLLMLLGDGLLGDRIPLPPNFKDPMIDRIGATLLAAASPAHLMASLPTEPRFICKDDDQPDVYMVGGELFFPSLAQRRIMALDIHDIAQHALQLTLYPQEFTAVAAAAGRAFTWTDTASPEAIHSRSLSSFVWGTVFEEAVIGDDKELFSYGCLNWLAPGDTPTDRITSMHDLPHPEQRLAYRWHCLDALKDLYRKQAAIENQLGQPLDWMERMGYEGNSRFTELCRSADPFPFVPLDFYEADNLVVTSPSTPEELMGNALSLLNEEGLLLD